MAALSIGMAFLAKQLQKTERARRQAAYREMAAASQLIWSEEAAARSSLKPLSLA